MLEPTLGTFPFGLPVLRRRPSAKSKRRVYVLGATPSALHIAWWAPTRKLVKALPVDNEPTPFWNGSDEVEQIAEWKKLVRFRLGEWGEVATSDLANGAAGRWLDEHVLGPLGVTRDEACLSTCLDTYLADAVTAFGIRERYWPWAREVGQPEAKLEPHPRDGTLLELASTEHRERLLHELSVTVPEIVVTLGNVALKVLRAITETQAGPAKLHPDERYGVETPLILGKRSAVWMALTRPGTPAAYAEPHERWRSRVGRGTLAVPS